MATKASHKRPHKFKHKKVVKKKHKTIRKQVARVQPETERQESVVSTQAPVVGSGFTRPYATTSQVDTVVGEQPQQAQVQSKAQGQEPQPIIAPPTLSENPKTVDSKENPSQSGSTEQTSGVSATTVSQEKAIPTPQVVPSGSSENKPPLENIEPEHKKGSKIWIILALVILLVLVGGGLYYFRQEVLLKSVEQKEEPTSTPSQVSPSPKPEEATDSAELEADPSEFSIKVLNGSGTAGVAAEARDILEEAGFVVEDIGNADASNYEKTIIRAKENVSKDFLDLLREELGKLYLLDSNEELGEEEDTDVVVIVGKEEV